MDGCADTSAPTPSARAHHPPQRILSTGIRGAPTLPAARTGRRSRARSAVANFGSGMPIDERSLSIIGVDGAPL